METNRQHNKTLNWIGRAPPPFCGPAKQKQKEREKEKGKNEKGGKSKEIFIFYFYFLLVSSYFKQNPLRE